MQEIIETAIRQAREEAAAKEELAEGRSAALVAYNVSARIDLLA